MQERLSKVTDEDLKTLDREQLGLLSTNVQNLLGMVLDSSKLVEFSEKSALTICLRLLNSGVLAKRLDGAAQLEASLLSLRPRDAAAAGAAVCTLLASPHHPSLLHMSLMRCAVLCCAVLW